MQHRVRIRQRVGIDADLDGGTVPGEGAALIDLAVLEREMTLPFPPFPDLEVSFGDLSVELDRIGWDPADEKFVCEAEPMWAETNEHADRIVHALVDVGFCPADGDRRGAEH